MVYRKLFASHGGLLFMKEQDNDITIQFMSTAYIDERTCCIN